MRNELYERRFELTRDERGERGRFKPLFISESLTAKNLQLFNVLLEARRDGLIYTVYTRPDLVHFKANRESRGRRVDDAQQLKSIIENAKSEAGDISAGRPPRLGAPLTGAPTSRRGGAGPPHSGRKRPHGWPMVISEFLRFVGVNVLKISKLKRHDQ